jgi:hypothetical protein
MENIKRQEKKDTARGKTQTIVDKAAPKPEEQKAQPWKELIGQIESNSKDQSEEGDFFVAKDGFYSHSLSA